MLPPFFTRHFTQPAMEKETESAQDYYVLFQDLSKHAQRLNQSGESELREGKEGSAVQFLWCYIGKLTARQARGVEIKLDLEFTTRFENECPWYQELNERLIKTVRESNRSRSTTIGHQQDVSQKYQGETTKPDVVFLKYTSAQRLQILQEKGLVARSDQGTEHFVVSKTKPIAPKIWRSFVQLFPLSTLTEIWHRVGCPTGVEPLRCTAVVWCRETFWNENISSVGPKMCPEEVEIVFKSSLDDQGMVASQREVLKKCVDVANRVREIEGCKDMNIENKYGLVQENIEGQPPAKPPKQIAESAHKPTPKKNTEQESRETGSKYEVPVQTIIDENIVEVVVGKAEQLTRKEIALKLKNEWKEFKAVKVSSIEKRVGETKAWEAYDKMLEEAWKEANFGETFIKRKKGGKRHNKKSMDPYRDVNSDGDGDFSGDGYWKRG